MGKGYAEGSAVEERLAAMEFSDAQRRNVEQLLEAWERTLGRAGR